MAATPRVRGPSNDVVTAASLARAVSESNGSVNGNGHGPSRGDRLAITSTSERLTHYLFRYPAKFHAPVARALVEQYTEPGSLILDPFCGSGTLLVEAVVAGRSAVGIDVDPIAALVSAAKVRRFNATRLKKSVEDVLTRLSHFERSIDEYAALMFGRLGDDDYRCQLSPVQPWVPALPNIEHWFRDYVVIDLGRIRKVIETTALPESHRLLMRVVFASIIRNASNADPVPVSGLEVTSYMKARDARGRLINPFALFRQSLDRAVSACAEFALAAATDSSARAVEGDATRLGRHLRKTVDAVITSPPYHGAVEYYRRHTLEMYWLGATTTHEERLALLQKYIGRPKVARRHPYVSNGALSTTLASKWEKRIRAVSDERADAFRHYMVGMSKFFDGLAAHLHERSPVVLVVGHSTWNKSKIPTTRLFEEIAHDHFELDEVRWYPVKNRYMSYSRHNGADIDEEYVLVLRRRATQGRQARV